MYCVYINNKQFLTVNGAVHQCLHGGANEVDILVVEHTSTNNTTHVYIITYINYDNICIIIY